MIALQAQTRLLRTARLTGNLNEEGRDLEEIYQSFTEGHSLADLKEAKSLLDAWKA